MKKKSYGLSIQTVVRIIQILQEAIITGTDISDLLTDMRLQVSNDGTNKLDLSAEYVKQVEEWHKTLLDTIENSCDQENKEENGKGTILS